MPEPILQLDRPGRVLVVDDEQDILDSLKTLLESALPGLECLIAPSGAEGLRILAKGGVDMVISDYKMPEMNGLRFLEQARAMAPHVPRLLMTAFPHLEVAIEAINEARVEVFLTKPLDPDKLLKVVAEKLNARAPAARPAQG